MGYCSFGLQMSWENLEANSWILEESASVTALENFGVVVVTDSGRRPHCSSMAGGPRHKTYQSAWAVAGAESFREAVQSATSGIKGEDWRDGGSMLRTRPNNLFLLPYSMWSQASQNVSDLNVSEWSFLIRETRNGVFLLCCSLSSVCEWNPAARSATLQPLPKKSRAKSRTRRRRRWFWYVLITFFLILLWCLTSWRCLTSWTQLDPQMPGMPPRNLWRWHRTARSRQRLDASWNTWVFFVGLTGLTGLTFPRDLEPWWTVMLWYFLRLMLSLFFSIFTPFAASCKAVESLEGLEPSEKVSELQDLWLQLQEVPGSAWWVFWTVGVGGWRINEG